MRPFFLCLFFSWAVNKFALCSAGRLLFCLQSCVLNKHPWKDNLGQKLWVPLIRARQPWKIPFWMCRSLSLRTCDFIHFCLNTTGHPYWPFANSLFHFPTDHHSHLALTLQSYLFCNYTKWLIIWLPHTINISRPFVFNIQFHVYYLAGS